MEQRIAIFNLILEGEPTSRDVNIQKLAQQADGFSGSDIRELCRNASVYRVRDFMRSGTETDVRWLIYCITKPQTKEPSCKVGSASLPSTEYCKFAPLHFPHLLLHSWHAQQSTPHTTIMHHSQIISYILPRTRYNIIHCYVEVNVLLIVLHVILKNLYYPSV